MWGSVTSIIHRPDLSAVPGILPGLPAGDLQILLLWAGRPLVFKVMETWLTLQGFAKKGFEQRHPPGRCINWRRLSLIQNVNPFPCALLIPPQTSTGSAWRRFMPWPRTEPRSGSWGSTCGTMKGAPLSPSTKTLDWAMGKQLTNCMSGNTAELLVHFDFSPLSLFSPYFL